MLSAAEVAALLGCSRRHVYHLVDRDQLPGARRLGHRVLIVRPVLEAWLLGGDPGLSALSRQVR
ncbi:MAG: helix-turn-helix domain-containing protein [Actinomycetales bacterium]|nr:helix-turn-helix domain-containing protein [Actinomycetales bacterium]